jgi:hypothetical protein
MSLYITYVSDGTQMAVQCQGVRKTVGNQILD